MAAPEIAPDPSRINLPPSVKYFSPRELKVFIAMNRVGILAEDAEKKAAALRQEHALLMARILKMPSYKLWDAACAVEMERWSEFRDAQKIS